MIITRPKSKEEILKMLELFPGSNICVVGCNICARKIGTGGEVQVKKMYEFLRKKGVDVLDGIMVKHACSAASWQELVEENPVLDKARLLLIMSCGAGVSLMGRISDKPALPALDTTSLGGTAGDETLETLCSMCGECNVGLFASICPKTGCPKSLVNGPCGGSENGKCEVEGLDCIWVRIYETLETRDMLALLDGIQQPVKYDRV